MEFIIDILVVLALLVWTVVGIITIKNYVVYNALIKPIIKPMIEMYQKMVDEMKEEFED